MVINLYGIFAFFLTIAVAVAYINHRFIKMQMTVAMMFAALIMSLTLLIFARSGFNGWEHQLQNFLNKLDFHSLLMNGMLSFLLFAGAMTVNLNDFLSEKWDIGILASVGTLVSTLLIGILVYFTLPLVGVNLNFIFCLLFGALISPTDPIAVLAMCKDLNAPRKLTASIAGESLFNDGVGIVIFVSLYQFAFGGADITVTSVTLLFFREAIGGIGYGVILGMFGYWLIKPVDDYKIQVLVTIAMTTGGYALAQMMDISGPLAMVVSGIFLGNTGGGANSRFKMSKKVSDHLFTFWELIDEILNALLFLLIGFEFLMLSLERSYILAGLMAIPIVLLVRFVIVGTPITLFKMWKNYSPHVVKILTWGGLRGGLAVALALTLPRGEHRDLIVAMTYAVVVFSMLVQGTTIKRLVKKSRD